MTEVNPPKKSPTQASATKKSTRPAITSQPTAPAVPSPIPAPAFPKAPAPAEPKVEFRAPQPALPSHSPLSSPHVPLPLATRRTWSEAPLPVPPVLLAGDYPDSSLFGDALSRAKPSASAGTNSAAKDPQPISAPTVVSAEASTPVSEPAEGTQEPSAPTTTSSSVPTEVLVWLDARDPFSLLAHWDAEETSLQRFCAAFPGDALRLRVYARQVGGVLMSDQIVISTARHRLVPVLYANTPYVAELGFVDSAGIWRSLATSPKIQTPPDHHVSEWTERRGRFQARPIPPPQSTEPNSAPEPITPSFAPAPASDLVPTPAPAASPASPLPPLLDEPAAQYLTTLVWEPAPVIISPGSSVEMAQWVAKVVTTRWENPTPLSPSSPEQTRPTSDRTEVPEVPGSVPAPAPSPSSFWFKVNAELIVYGSTEPDAHVTLGGRPIRLREDGSFSFRFSLPDGDYELPALAVKADGSDQRAARLQFQRTTTRHGDVGNHPTDPHWKPPVPESLP